MGAAFVVKLVTGIRIVSSGVLSCSSEVVFSWEFILYYPKLTSTFMYISSLIEML